jgi:hypothetical protein
MSLASLFVTGWLKVRTLGKNIIEVRSGDSLSHFNSGGD